MRVEQWSVDGNPRKLLATAFTFWPQPTVLTMSADETVFDAEARMEKALQVFKQNLAGIGRDAPTRDWSIRCGSKSTARPHRSSSWPRSDRPSQPRS